MTFNNWVLMRLRNPHFSKKSNILSNKWPIEHFFTKTSRSLLDNWTNNLVDNRDMNIKILKIPSKNGYSTIIGLRMRRHMGMHLCTSAHPCVHAPVHACTCPHLHALSKAEHLHVGPWASMSPTSSIDCISMASASNCKQFGLLASIICRSNSIIDLNPTPNPAGASTFGSGRRGFRGGGYSGEQVHPQSPGLVLVNVNQAWLPVA